MHVIWAPPVLLLLSVLFLFVLASPSYRVGYSLAHLPEVRAALGGRYEPVFRQRFSDAAPPGLSSISRAAALRALGGSPPDAQPARSAGPIHTHLCRKCRARAQGADRRSPRRAGPGPGRRSGCDLSGYFAVAGGRPSSASSSCGGCRRNATIVRLSGLA